MVLCGVRLIDRDVGLANWLETLRLRLRNADGTITPTHQKSKCSYIFITTSHLA